MKKLSVIALIFALSFIGCQEESSILEPSNHYTEGDLSKGRPIFNSDEIVLLDNSDNLTNYHTVYSENFTVDGRKGGRVAIRHQYKDVNGRMVQLSAELRIPKGAFTGKLNFDMIFDLDNLSLELYPSPFVFDKPVALTMNWYGLDLSGYTKDDLNFNYLDGESEDLQYDLINIDLVNGDLDIWNAKLDHFSRYGWTRTKTTR